MSSKNLSYSLIEKSEDIEEKGESVTYDQFT